MALLARPVRLGILTENAKHFPLYKLLALNLREIRTGDHCPSRRFADVRRADRFTGVARVAH